MMMPRMQRLMRSEGELNTQSVKIIQRKIISIIEFSQRKSKESKIIRPRR